MVRHRLLLGRDGKNTLVKSEVAPDAMEATRLLAIKRNERHLQRARARRHAWEREQA